MKYAIAYLAAIVIANVSIAEFGSGAAPFVGFVLIGAILVLRDALHDKYGPYVLIVLIPIGTVLSGLFGPAVARISVGGTLAFALSEIVDTAVYHWARQREWEVRVTLSNVCSAAVDSCVFFLAAFGTFPIGLVILQFTMKVLGGTIWMKIIKPFKKTHLSIVRS